MNKFYNFLAISNTELDPLDQVTPTKRLERRRVVPCITSVETTLQVNLLFFSKPNSPIPVFQVSTWPFQVFTELVNLPLNGDAFGGMGPVGGNGSDERVQFVSFLLQFLDE